MEEEVDFTKIMDDGELKPDELMKAIHFLAARNDDLASQLAQKPKETKESAYKNCQRHLETAIKNVDFANPVQVSRFCMSGERFLDQSIWPNTLEFGEQMKFAIDLPAGSWSSLMGQIEAIPLNLLRSLNGGFGKERVILTDQQRFDQFRVPDEKVTDDQFRVVASEYLHLYLKTKKTSLEAMDVKEAMQDFGRRFDNPIFQNKWDELAGRQEKWNDLVQTFLAQVEFAQAVTGPRSLNKVSVRRTEEYRKIQERQGKEGQRRPQTCFLCGEGHPPRSCFILDEMRREVIERPGREYCLLHGKSDHKSMECLWLSVAKYVKERKIPLEGDYPWSEAISQYGELAASKFKCLAPNEWKRGISRKRERERPQEDKVKRRKLETTLLDDLLNGKVTLEELKEKSNGLSNFFGSRKEFTHNTGQKDHKVLVKMTEEGFTVHIGDLVRDLSPEICQIKDKLFTIPCMVNGITTQALCDSGACGIDVVSKNIFEQSNPETPKTLQR